VNELGRVTELGRSLGRNVTQGRQTPRCACWLPRSFDWAACATSTELPADIVRNNFHPFRTCRRFLVPNATILRAFQLGTTLARANHVERYIAVFLGVLMLGSLGAFLLYVPVLPLAVVVILLLSLVLMFVLGVQTGRRRIRISRV